MSARISLLALGLMVLLLPARLIAGGPPMLCLPIVGVNAENKETCVKMLSSKLQDKVWSSSEDFPGIRLQQQGSQWYLSFHMKEDVQLSEITAALKGTVLTIPPDRLRLFGHVTLTIDNSSATSSSLLAELKTLDSMAVAEVQTKGNQTRVRLNMPYPVDRSRGSVGWDKFAWNDFASEAAPSKDVIPSEKLPGYGAIRDLVTKHKGTLRDMSWSMHDACRALGGVAASPSTSSRRDAITTAATPQ